MTSAISCPLWSSVYECHRVECAFTSPVRTEYGMLVLYAVLYVRVSCFVVRGCAVSRGIYMFVIVICFVPLGLFTISMSSLSIVINKQLI